MYLTLHLLAAPKSPLFTLDHLPRNVTAPVSGVICRLTDEEMPSLAAKNAGYGIRFGMFP